VSSTIEPLRLSNGAQEHARCFETLRVLFGVEPGMQAQSLDHVAQRPLGLVTDDGAVLATPGRNVVDKPQLSICSNDARSRSTMCLVVRRAIIDAFSSFLRTRDTLSLLSAK
jgi:hypothetical protein